MTMGDNILDRKRKTTCVHVVGRGVTKGFVIFKQHAAKQLIIFCDAWMYRREHERSGGRGGGGYGWTESELGSSLTLTDSIGQKLEVLLENHLGEGGQRHVIVYCPVWMVNTSHYRLRYLLGATPRGVFN